MANEHPSPGSTDVPLTEPVHLRAVAVETALAAGALLREHFGRVQQVEHKGEIDLVTALDRQVEALIVERLVAAFPDHAVLAEEGTTVEGGAGHRWLVDPLDGTTNYAHGYPVFAVSLAYAYEGRVRLGVVYDPLRDELFVGEAGRGATLNGQPLCVSATRALDQSLLISGFPYDRAEFPRALQLWGALLGQAQALRRGGSAALDLCYVAAGRAAGFWERHLKRWDMAAGALLVVVAAGQVSAFRGGPFDVYDDQAIATNGVIHAALVDALAAASG